VPIRQQKQDKVKSSALFVLYNLRHVHDGFNACFDVLDPSKFQGMIDTQFAHSPLPHPAIVAFAQPSAWAESVVRVLILVGLVTRLSLIGGALLMIVLTFGTCLAGLARCL
jgi:uncharacterized membrane protein YphA (DoxX/SURF4 family)